MKKQKYWNRPPTTYGGVKQSKVDLTSRCPKAERAPLEKTQERRIEVRINPFGTTWRTAKRAPRGHHRIASSSINPAGSKLSRQFKAWSAPVPLFFFSLSSQLTSHTNSLHRAALHERGIVRESGCRCRRLADKFDGRKNGWLEHGSFPSSQNRRLQGTKARLMPAKLTQEKIKVTEWNGSDVPYCNPDGGMVMIRWLACWGLRGLVVDAGVNAQHDGLCLYRGSGQHFTIIEVNHGNQVLIGDVTNISYPMIGLRRRQESAGAEAR